MLLMALMLLPVAKAQDGGERLTVTGTVINGADGNPLPFCFVYLMQDGRSRAMAVTDYAGNYTLPPIVAGTYTVLVLQFGDTLMHYKGLNIERDTWVRSVVLPPSDDSNNDALPQYVDGKIKYLRPVLIYSHRHSLLAKMGMLITDPGDPRLWNFSGRMDPFFFRPYRDFHPILDQERSRGETARHRHRRRPAPCAQRRELPVGDLY